MDKRDVEASEKVENELQMIIDSVASDEAAEERSQVSYGLLMSRILELMIKLDSVTVMEVSVVIQFADCLKQLDDASEEVDKNDLSSLISPIEKYIHMVYSLLNKFFVDWNFTVDSVYYSLLTSLLSWTDANDNIVHNINSNGYLWYHARHLSVVKIKEQEIEVTVLEEVVLVMLMILHNCVMDPNLPHFYYTDVINWDLLLTPWVKCSHYSMRLFSRFVLGYMIPGLQEQTLQLLDMDRNDWNIFITLLEECCQPPFSATIYAGLHSRIEEITQLLKGFPQFTRGDVVDKGTPNTIDDLPDHLLNLTVSENEATVTVDFEGNPCCSIPAAEMVTGLSNLITRKSNLDVFGSYSFLPHLVNLLTDGENEDKIAVCKLLLTLQFDSEIIKNELCNEKSCLSVLIQGLRAHDVIELQELSKCIFINTMDNSDALLYAKVCYKYRMYKECEKQCNRLVNNVEAKILKAKCLYYLYVQEHMLLNQRSASLSKQVLQDELKRCYSKAREVISILGRALDENLSLFDIECSEMLDLVMIDYMHNTNKLRDTKRCLLCRVYQGFSLVSKNTSVQPSGELNHNSTIDNISDNTKFKQSKKSKQTPKAGLLASHLYPESILKQFFSAVPLAKGKKVFSVSGLKGIHDASLHSYGEITLYMLCHSCEELFSVSESWFLQNFFKKIYNINQPLSAKCEQSIPYNGHLYKFCLSLIFRFLWFNGLQFLNSGDVYCLLQQCRRYLLRTDHVPVSKPNVYLLISPLGEDDGKELGFINHYLTATLNHSFGFHPLGADLEIIRNHPYTKVHFFFIRMGVINILVKFEPSQDYPIDDQFQIADEGGIYYVPHNDNRKKLLPPGLYALFQLHAMKMEESWLEKPHLTYKPLKDPDDNAAKTFRILEAQHQDEGRIVTEKKLRSASEKHCRKICFLPNDFNVNPPVTLPKDHVVVLHHTHGGQQTGVILFICVGLDDNSEYGIEKPYVVYYTYQPGLSYSCGFFISQDLKAVGYLPKSRGTGTVTNPDEFLQREDFTTIIKCTLEEKGFYNLNSLLCRLKNITLSCSRFPLLDAQCTPCSAEELKRCAYCINRCDCCFQWVPGIPLTLEGPEESDLDFIFCSRQCYQASVEPPKFSYYYIIKDNNLISVDGKLYPYLSEKIVPCCGPVLLDHKLILHLITFTVNWAGYTRQSEIALCAGSFTGFDTNMTYVVYHGRSLTGQQALEFFLMDDLSPGNPLPYLQHQEIAETIAELKDDGFIQEQLNTLIQMLSSISGTEIPATLIGIINMLPSALAHVQLLNTSDKDSALCDFTKPTNNQSQEIEEEMQLENIFKTSEN